MGQAWGGPAAATSRRLESLASELGPWWWRKPPWGLVQEGLPDTHHTLPSTSSLSFVSLAARGSPALPATTASHLSASPSATESSGLGSNATSLRKTSLAVPTQLT